MRVLTVIWPSSVLKVMASRSRAAVPRLRSSSPRCSRRKQGSSVGEIKSGAPRCAYPRNVRPAAGLHASPLCRHRATTHCGARLNSAHRPVRRTRDMVARMRRRRRATSGAGPHPRNMDIGHYQPVCVVLSGCLALGSCPVSAYEVWPAGWLNQHHLSKEGYIAGQILLSPLRPQR